MDNFSQSTISIIKNFLASELVVQLDLSPRTRNALLRSGINTALEIQKLLEKDLLAKVPNIGPLAINEIQQCMDSLIKIKGFDQSRVKDGLFNDTHLEEIIIPKKYFNDLPIDVLAEELGIERLERLKRAGLVKLGELAELAHVVSNFFQNTALSLDKLIDYQKRLLQAKIQENKLHPSTLYRGTNIRTWLAVEPQQSDERLELLNLLAEVNEASSLTAELSSLTTGLSDRDIKVYTSYFSGNVTLEQLGRREGITRERVRQITTKVAKKIWTRINQNPSLYFQSALLMAQDMGIALSLEAWKLYLQQKKLIDSRSFNQDIDLFVFLCAVLRSSEKVKFPLKIEINKELVQVLNSSSNLTLGTIQAIDAMPSSAKREVRRRISYVGGIHLSEASDILDVPAQQAADILKHLGFKEVVHEWYTISSGDFSSRWPILKAGLAMMQVCGPLEFNLFCDGLRRYISRFYDVLAPPKVLKAHLEVLGFELEDELVCWTETPSGYLADSDFCFVKAVEKYGPIVSFQEVIEFFQEHNFSIATATARVLSQSPIVERVDVGLYKLRGHAHTWRDVENAKKRQEIVDYDPEVTYGIDGIIRYRVTIGTWALNGVLSISSNQQPLPDLGDGWPIFVKDQLHGTARRNDYLIWGLGGAFNTLNVQVGDRIELAFDVWEDPFIRITKILI